MEATDRQLPEIAPQIERRILGSHGAAVIERLRELPPADQVADVDELETSVHEVAELLVAWLGDIGFRWDDVPDSVYFHVLKPAKWLGRRTLGLTF
jgi:hypothetical protein